MSTETKTISWGSRLGNSFKGLLFGLILIVASAVLLFWNEGRTIKMTKALKEGAKVVVEATPDVVNSENDGKLVHLSGDAQTDDVLTDDFFGVQLNAITLERNVQIYQWTEDVHEETTRKSGGSQEVKTTYSYRKEWVEGLVDSSAFHDSGHDNPTSVPVESMTLHAANVQLGAFQLNSTQIDRIGNYKDYSPNSQIKDATETTTTPEETAPIEEPSAQYNAAENNARYAQESEPLITINPDEPAPSISISTNDAPATITVTGDDADNNDANIATNPTDVNVSTSAEPDAVDLTHVNGFTFANGVYYKGDPANAQIGDIKVALRYVPTPSTISLVAKQVGNTFEPYLAKSGANVDLFADGTKSAEAMFEQARKNNQLMAWLLRALGVFLCFIGFKTLFQPLEVLADFIPFLAKVVGFGTSLVSACCAGFVSLVAIAVGYLYYRPVIGITLLVIAFGLLLYPFMKGKNKAKETV